MRSAASYTTASAATGFPAMSFPAQASARATTGVATYATMPMSSGFTTPMSGVVSAPVSGVASTSYSPSYSTPSYSTPYAATSMPYAAQQSSRVATASPVTAVPATMPMQTMSSPMTTNAVASSYRTAPTAFTTSASAYTPAANTYSAPAASTFSAPAATTYAAPAVSTYPSAAKTTYGVSSYEASTYTAAPITTTTVQPTTRVVQSGITQAMPSTAALLAQGQVVAERVIPISECYGTGLVRSEGDVAIAEPPPVVVYDSPVVYEQPQTVVMEPETVVVQEEVVVAPGGQVVEVAQTVVEEQPRKAVVVIVSTSGNVLGDHPTGAWLEEIAGPYFVFAEAGCEVHVASSMGGPVPIDEASMQEQFFTENAQRFLQDGGEEVLGNTLTLSEISPEQIDCVFLAGGHGVYADFEEHLAQFVTDMNVMGKVVGAVCHGPVGLMAAINPESQPLVAGRKVTGFSNEEEAAVGLDGKVPYLLEEKMKELGGIYECSSPWSEFAVRDGNLCTGQNPQSSVQCALLCVEALQQSIQQMPM